MPSCTAWVITSLHYSVRPNDNVPGTAIGEPLALFPARTGKDRIEGAMIAIFQMAGGSLPSLCSGYTRSRTDVPYPVEWDYPGKNARIGHNPQIWAHHARSSTTSVLSH
jgi:hypothetical protein